MGRSKQRKSQTIAPDGACLTMAEAVALTGVSPGHVARAVKLGHVKPVRNGKYEREALLIGLVKYQAANWGQLPVYDNAVQCSVATGIPLDVIRKARMSARLGQGGWIELGALLKAIFAANGESSDEIKRHFAALREKLNYQRENGEVLMKGPTAHTIKKGLADLFRGLDQRSNVDLPPALEGLNAAAMQRELVKSDNKLKAKLIADWSLLMKNGEAKDAR